MRVGAHGPSDRLLARAIGLLLPYGVLVLSRGMDCLYILQLERYKPERYRGWLTAHGRSLVSRGEVALECLTVAVAVVLVGAGGHWLWAVALWIATGHVLFRRQRSLQVSQRLQWTARAVRVAVLTLAISILASAAVLILMGFVLPAPAARLTVGGIAALAVVGLLSPGIVLAAACLTCPWERAIARSFLTEADRRMRAYPGRVLGITGSYGKTTTKLIVADLLAARYRVLKTPAGVNTTMGITRVIREELAGRARVLRGGDVSPMGPGEIREVCEIVHPGLGILTAVGVQHLERFGTPERIAEAKYELMAALPGRGAGGDQCG